MYDILIIGAGPAGLAAAIYGRRAGKSVLIIEKESFGGQMNFSPKIENYPGFGEVSGMELSDKMVEQAIALGAEVELDTVLGLEDKGDSKILHCEGGDFHGKAVIIATGAKHRHLGVDGEAELIGEGISFCAVCDGAFYEGKDVIVIGGGNSALQEAVLLSKTSKSVTVIQNLPHLTGEQKLQDILYADEKVSFIMPAEILSFSKEGEKVSVNINADGEAKTVTADGVFVAIGLAPDNEAFKDNVELQYGYVKADESCLTSKEGIFTAGDCRTKSIRQIATAVSDGATAALAAISYIG